MQPARAALLDITGVSKVFPGVRALERVLFALDSGEVHALVGEKGADKSTIVEILGGVYKPDGGAIWFDGEQAKVPAGASIARARDWLGAPGAHDLRQYVGN